MNLANFYDNSQHTDTPPKGTGGGAGSTTPPAAPPTADVTPEQREANERARADDMAKVLYGETVYREAESVLLPDSTLDATPEQLTAAREAYRGELSKVEFAAPLAKSLTEQYLAGMRNPISDEQHAAQRTKMHAELVQRFGRDGAAEKLADVRALLAKSQYISDALVDSGLDVNIEAILALAEHARTQRGRGKL